SHNLGVIGITRTSTSNQITDLELSNTVTHLDHLAGTAIAKRRIGVELLHHSTIGLHRALTRQRIDNLLDLLGTLFGLADQALPGGSDCRAFGATADDGVVISNKNKSGTNLRHRNILNFHVTGAELLR